MFLFEMDKLDQLLLNLFSLFYLQLPFPVVVPEGNTMEQFETHTFASWN